MHNGDIFQLWYNGHASCTRNRASTTCPSTDYPNRTSVPVTDRSIGATYYAESSDGLSWTRPALGQVPWPTVNGSKANNMAFDGGSADTNRGVYLDPHEDDPSRKYKAFGSFKTFNGQSVGSSRLGIVTSPDGKSWSGYTAVDAMDVNADTANNMIWDEDLQLYLAFMRKDVQPDNFGLRREYRSTAPSYVGP